MQPRLGPSLTPPPLPLAAAASFISHPGAPRCALQHSNRPCWRHSMPLVLLLLLFAFGPFKLARSECDAVWAGLAGQAARGAWGPRGAWPLAFIVRHATCVRCAWFASWVGLGRGPWPRGGAHGHPLAGRGRWPRARTRGNRESSPPGKWRGNLLIANPSFGCPSFDAETEIVRQDPH